MSYSQGSSSSSRHEAPKLPLHSRSSTSRQEDSKLSLHSDPLRQSPKPNRPLQGVSRTEANTTSSHEERSKLAPTTSRQEKGSKLAPTTSRQEKRSKLAPSTSSSSSSSPGQPDHSQSDASSVDFNSLQLAIDAGQWKEDLGFLWWIFNHYLKKVEKGHAAPPGFGSSEFWDVVNRDIFTDDGDDREMAMGEGAIDDNWNDSTPPFQRPPFLAGVHGDEDGQPNLVDYSDSEEEDDDDGEQVGGGAPAAPPPVDNHFQLSEAWRVWVKKFKIHGKGFFVRLRNLDQMTDLERMMIEIFRQALDGVFDGADPTDQVGVKFIHHGLRRGYYTVPFQRREELTPERVFRILEWLIGYDEVNLDDNMQIVVTRIPQTRGGVKRDGVWNKAQFMQKHSNSFIQINNSGDDLCLARALVVAKARLDKDTDEETRKHWHAIRKGDASRCTLQKRMAKQLMERAGLKDHKGPCGEDEIRKLQAVLAPEYQIKIFSAACGNFITFQGETESEKVLHIYHATDGQGDPGHFYVCTKPHVLFRKQCWCDKCNRAFDKVLEHKCIDKCNCCFKLKKCELEGWKHCDDCNRNFRSEQCFQNHVTVSQARGGVKKQRVNLSLCQKFKTCKDCGRMIDFRRAKKTVIGNQIVAVHHCGLVYCRNCDKEHPEGSHECFMQVIKEKKPKASEKKKEKETEDLTGEDKEFLSVLMDLAGVQSEEEEEEEVDVLELIGGMEEEPSQEEFTESDDRGTKIFFDFESTQTRYAGENKLGPIFEHVPNYCVAFKTCTQCREEKKKGNFNTCKFCSKGKWIFKGEDCRDNFCKWLFSEDNRGSTAIAHNSKGYDSQFLVQYLIQETMIPKVISKGREFMKVEYNKIRVIDSLNFFPMGLADLPKAFNIKELKKGFFPHKFNTDENQGYRGKIPDAWYFDPGNMKPKKRDQFYTWYTQQLAKGEDYIFAEEIEGYCVSDVDILFKACSAFEEEVQDLTGVKPFDVAVTIASFCMHLFRKKFLKEGTIGLIPHGGYRGRENQSLMGLRWLKWLSESQDIYIQHAGNGYEKKVDNFKVDGFDPATNTIYEFNGCIYHGHTCRLDRKQKVPNRAQTMEEAYQATINRKAHLQSKGYTVVEKWECELTKELKEDPEMQKFFNTVDLPEPLDINEALRGGRTNATKLYYKCKEGERMFYVDVVSLYPWGVKWTEYPVGHPKVITENFQPITKDNNPYFGIIRCKVLPPKQLHHPVLPYKCNGKLCFPLCRSCTQEQKQGFCTHSDAARAFTGEFVSTELDLALEKGYEVLKIHEVWHYAEKGKHDGKDEETGLFTKYINFFLKLKIEASGWPENVKTEEEKERFIQECEEREGITLDPTRIEKNPGRRQVAKLCLNSFWGKFGQRSNMSKDEFVTDSARFAKILFDQTNIVEDVRVINEEMVYVTYKKEEEFVEVLPYMNKVIAAFTTANCRIRLYRELEQLGARVCYMDTDSVIYVTGPGDVYHPKLGSFLGEMTNELEEYGPGAYIEEFVSGGPKNYGFKVRKANGKSETKVKIRGFTLNFHAANKLNFKNLKDKVFKFVKEGLKEKTTVVQPQIARTSDRKVVTQDVAKDYGIVYDKRWVLKDFSTLPYGTCEEI